MEKKIILWSIFAIISIVILFLLTNTYSGLLGARVAPGLRFTINGPNELPAGQSVIVSWNTSPESQRQYPSEKIEFCQGRLFGKRCVTLNENTPNDGEALVFVPNIPPASGYLRLTARISHGGALLPQVTMSRPVRLVMSNLTAQRSVIAPVNVGGGSIATLTAVGPRIAVEQGSTYTIILPEPSALKKIEICQQGQRCLTVASSVQGASAQIRIPNMSVGSKAELKVTERGSDNRLTGRVFFRRALLVKAARPIQITQENSDSGGNGGGSSNSSPTPLLRAIAQFIVPVNDEQIVTGSDLDVRVQLSGTTGTNIGCQQWKLNGRILTPSDWVGDQSPDLSAGLCN